MGIVHEAHDPELGRRVAIKLVRAGGDQQRLRREAQALARLSHPNVVQVHECDIQDDQLFIVMELVRGKTLDQWQSRVRPWRECIEVYGQAGRGLAAAHAVGLVHRDFKPNNCVVDETGRVKVLDFGLAYLMDDHVHEPTGQTSPDTGLGLTSPGTTPRRRLTRTGGVLGTRSYMAPEQLDRREVSARSDQFSFCVALYEALLGQPPFGIDPGPVLEQMARGSFHSPAPPPRRRPLPRWLRRIVWRGLSARPEDRWPSMADLVDALERGRRIHDTTPWLTRGLVLVMAGTLWFQAPPETPAPPSTPSELLPETKELREQMERTRTMAMNGEYRAGLEAIAAIILGAEQAGDSRLLADALVLQGKLLVGDGHHDEADQSFHMAIDLARAQSFAEPHIQALAGRIHIVGIERAHTEAALWLGRWAELLANLYDVDPALRAEVLTAIAQVRTSRGEYPEAEKRYAEAAELVEEYRGAGHIEMAEILDSWATTAERQGEWTRSEDLYRRAVQVRASWQGIDHEATASLRSNLAVVLHHQGKSDEVIDLYQHVLDVLYESAPPDPKRLAHAHANLGAVLGELGQLAEAETHARRAIEFWTQAGRGAHPLMARGQANLAWILKQQGPARHAEAIETYRKAVTILDGHEPNPDTDEVMLTALDGAGRLLLAQGDADQAAQLHRRALSIHWLGNRPEVERAHTLRFLARALMAQGRLEEARQALEQALDIYGRTEPCDALDPRHVADAERRLADVLERIGVLQPV
ncbi:tetratricopeptide repeat protein [Paraliomyxa miuraensis]|uniref:tetratricopeptide repeat protein n=1 Tax=Paraliomyxa miuraensis TaxID=376150 RepID=UPI0022518A26|nr:tetratricopeptide repeat protein [Paraliomyxa miuraensis]MCX4239425.1 tetratricopeptide repeat protein [Paraliomyxa miuraensis]